MQPSLFDPPLRPDTLSANTASLHRHPQRTELAAAKRVALRAGTHRTRAFERIVASGEAGYTVAELTETLGLREVQRTTIGPRVTELRDSGWVKDSGRTRPNAGGCEEIVWVATPEGVQTWRAMESA